MISDSLERAQRVVETVLREQLNDVVFDRILVKADMDQLDSGKTFRLNRAGLPPGELSFRPLHL